MGLAPSFEADVSLGSEESSLRRDLPSDSGSLVVDLDGFSWSDDCHVLFAAKGHARGKAAKLA